MNESVDVCMDGCSDPATFGVFGDLPSASPDA